jgi:NADH dehydrogenase FAD-containing subunit
MLPPLPPSIPTIAVHAFSAVSTETAERMFLAQLRCVVEESKDAPAGRPKSVWIATTPSTNFPRLLEDISLDVAVIGGGITGLTAACQLKRAGAA